MKKSIGLVFLLFLAVSLSGCTPASVPVLPAHTALPLTESPVPPTSTPVPSTNTPIPTATPTALPLFIPGANNLILTMVLQPDGKIVVGGVFTKMNGETRNYIARLNSDRTLDSSFNPEANGPVHALALQSDGKIVVGGAFKTLGGEPRRYIARLNPDGTLDTSFNPGAAFIDVGTDNRVFTLAVQSDGKIVVGGRFYSVDGATNKNFITRLNPDGTFDTAFNPVPVGSVLALALQADGKIILGGSFTKLNEEDRFQIARFNPDGTLDTSFNPGTSYEHGQDDLIFALALQPDNKIVVGGQFPKLDSGILRLNPDGTLDDSFKPQTEGLAFTLAVQTDGKIVLGGDFTTVNGEPHKQLARLNPDGTLDASFNPEFNGVIGALRVTFQWGTTGFTTSLGQFGAVWALVLQPDGKIMVGGSFTELNGEVRNSIAGLYPDGTLEEATLIP